MSLTLRETGPDEIEALIPILRQAEETEGALRWSLANLSDVVYRLDDDGQVVGAATMQWRGDACEIMELAIAPERQKQGLGKHLVAQLIQEARRRGKRQIGERVQIAAHCTGRGVRYAHGRYSIRHH